MADLNTRPVRLLLVAAGLLSLVTVGDGFLYLALADGGGLGCPLLPAAVRRRTNAGYLLLALPMGRLADRIGRSKVLLAGHIALIGAYAFALSSGAAPVRVVGTLALLGTFYACTDGVLSALAAGVVKTSSRASGIAAAQTVVAVARFASALAFGALWQAYDWRTGLLVMGAGMLDRHPGGGVAASPRTGPDPGDGLRDEAHSGSRASRWSASLALGGALSYFAYARSSSRATAPPAERDGGDAPRCSASRGSSSATPSSAATYGRLAVAALADPDGPRAFGDVSL